MFTLSNKQKNFSERKRNKPNRFNYYNSRISIYNEAKLTKTNTNRDVCKCFEQFQTNQPLLAKLKENTPGPTSTRFTNIYSGGSLQG